MVHPGDRHNRGRIWIGRISQPSRNYESDKRYTEHGEFSNQRARISPQHVYHSPILKQLTRETKELKQNGIATIKNYISEWFNWNRLRKQHQLFNPYLSSFYKLQRGKRSPLRNRSRQ